MWIPWSQALGHATRTRRSADYDVGTGYDTDQYWKLNLACREQLLPVLDREFEDATLLDVHTLLYLYHKEHAE